MNGILNTTLDSEIVANSTKTFR